MDSVYIGLTSSNRVTFAPNSTGLGSACQQTLFTGTGAAAALHVSRREMTHVVRARGPVPGSGRPVTS